MSLNFMYEAIRERSAEALQSELRYNDDGLKRDRIIVRIAALLHDVGHSPSPTLRKSLSRLARMVSSRYEHEDYSAAIIRTKLRDVIEDHPLNKNYGLTADQVADLLEGKASAGGALSGVNSSRDRSTRIGWTICCATLCTAG